MKFDVLWPEDLVEIIELLDNKARLVGGCVRDLILYNFLVEDIDIATKLLPEEVISRLETRFNVIPTGLKHGTVTVVKGGHKYEITTLRSDDKTDGRHAVVSFNKTWEEDSKRRDFTMNSLYMDLSGNVYDYNGGLEDLRARLVRFIGNPADRIHEDYLRILRFFRFLARFGKYDLDSLKSCLELAPNLVKVSRERITNEFLKIVEGQCFWQILPMAKPILEVIGLKDELKKEVFEVGKKEIFDESFQDLAADFDQNFSDFIVGKNDKVGQNSGFCEVGCDEVFENQNSEVFENTDLRSLSALGKVALFWNPNSLILLSNSQKKYVTNLQKFEISDSVEAAILEQKFGMDFVRDKMILDGKFFEFEPILPVPISGNDLMNLSIFGADIKIVLEKLNRFWVESGGFLDREILLKKASEIYAKMNENCEKKGENLKDSKKNSSEIERKSLQNSAILAEDDNSESF